MVVLGTGRNELSTSKNRKLTYWLESSFVCLNYR